MIDTVQNLTHLSPASPATRAGTADRSVAAFSVAGLGVAAPVVAELLSGSCPPVLFFVPWIFGLFVLFYGGSAILIRELTLRWQTGWKGVLLLGAAFAILHEGLATRAFFDPDWRSLGPMVGHGYAFGVNWIWTADAILYHAVLSTALPILLVYQVAPSVRTTPWLGARGLWGVGALFAFGAAVFLESGKSRYAADASWLWAGTAAIAVLVVLARFTRPSPAVAPRAAVHPRWFLALGAAAAMLLVLQIYVLPLLVPSPWITAAALAGGVLLTNRTLRRWSGGDMTAAQECGLLAGTFGFFAVLDFFQEVNPSRTDNPAGLSVVGAAALLFLYWLWKRALPAIDVSRANRIPTATLVAQPPVVTLTAPPATTTTVLTAPSPQVRPATFGVSRVERCVECAVAASALVSAAPLLVVLAWIVRRGTTGPALFRQVRLGLGGVPFTFVKFRTLYADARERFPELYAYRYSDAELRDLKFKVTDDPRVTPQGRWMRRSTLDELPNFWNVLRGDMALVGPRPEIPEMLPYYHGDMLRKFSVRPGITGLAQISGRGRLGFYETVDLDVEYVRTRSWRLDLKILLLTAYKILTRDGAF